MTGSSNKDSLAPLQKRQVTQQNRNVVCSYCFRLEHIQMDYRRAHNLFLLCGLTDH